MNSDLSVVKIAANDIQRIHKLAQAIWPPSFETILTPDQIAYMMEMMYAIPVLQKETERGVEYYVLMCGGEDVGYTAIEKKEETSYKLHKIYLSQKLQGQGLGKFQLRQMEQIAKKRGASWLYLNVNRHNKAVDFYKSQGYGILRSEDIDIGNGFLMNDYVMQKNLI